MSPNSPTKALYVLILVQLWERFSYHGMRVLLVLFLISKWTLTDAEAIGIYALYTALIKLGAIFGGYFGDYLIGPRAAVFFGASLICMGHVCLFLGFDQSLFLFGLALICSGTMLFDCNIKGILASLYKGAESAREAGFTIYYAGMNAGGFLAAVVCGYVAHSYGWNYGFGLAALGMGIGMLSLFFGNSILKQYSDFAYTISSLLKSTFAILVGVASVFLLLLNCHAISGYLPLIGSLVLSAYLLYLSKSLRIQALLQLTALLALLLFFFVCEEWMGSLLMVFTERHVDRTIFGLEIPSSSLAAVNPLTVMVMGGFIAKLIKGAEQNILLKLAISFSCLCLSFMFLFSATMSTQSAMLWIVISYILIALGELFIAPLAFAFASQIAPTHQLSMMMGLVIVTFSIAKLISGRIGQIASGMGIESLPILFGGVASISMIIVTVLILLSQTMTVKINHIHK